MTKTTENCVPKPGKKAEACEKDPLITVIMGVYNGQATLAEAIESIIAQTYTNWEMVICDDGSTDRSYHIAKAYERQYPDRIILLENETNQGLNKTLNRCLLAARGELIARQDADDISLPERFRKQVDHLLADPNCAFVSCGEYISDGTKRIGIRIQSKIRPEAKDFILKNPFFHPCAMIRREALERVGGYTEDDRLLRVEDYNLWSKLYAAGMYGENMQEAYYEFLENDETYQRRKFKYRFNGAYARALAIDMLGLPKICKVLVLRSIIVGLIPRSISKYLHRKQLLSGSRRLKEWNDKS